MKKHWIFFTAVLLVIVGIVLHFTVRDMFSFGDSAMNFFAAGNFSAGIFSAGIFSVGVFSIGIFSIGVFSISVFNIALYAIGIFMIAYKKKMAKLVETV